MSGRGWGRPRPWPLLVADCADPASLAALARAARVVVTTVGPYRPQGLALVEACAEAGTDYADLTGEVLFIRDSIDRCHAVARADRGADRALLRVRLGSVRPGGAAACTRLPAPMTPATCRTPRWW